MKQVRSSIVLMTALVLALFLAPAAAHEERALDGFDIEVGWRAEPIFVGQFNGPEVFIYLAEGDDHDAATLEISGAAGVPEVNVEAVVNDDGTVTINTTATNFVFSQENLSQGHVEGEGHAHLFVDGQIDRMFFGDPFDIELEPGMHELSVQLNANSHELLTFEGAAIETSTTVMVPETDHDAAAEGHDEDAESHDEQAADHDAADHGDAEDHTDDEAADHTHGARMGVVGAEETLQLEVSFGPASRIVQLQPVAGEPGHYIADLIPTRPGDYTMHLTGTINGVEIDEVFTSADGFFDTVEPASDIQFPDEGLTIFDLLARIEALEAQVDGD